MGKRDLFVSPADLKSARNDVLESFFNMGIGLVSFEGERPNYSCNDSMRSILELLMYALGKPSSTVTYSDCIRELYPDTWRQIDDSATKFMKSRNSSLNARLVFLTLYDKLIREYGEFQV